MSKDGFSEVSNAIFYSFRISDEVNEGSIRPTYSVLRNLWLQFPNYFCELRLHKNQKSFTIINVVVQTAWKFVLKANFMAVASSQISRLLGKVEVWNTGVGVIHNVGVIHKM